MLKPDSDRYSEDDLVAEFDRLFPQGFSGLDVRQEIAPEGWENSPLLAVCHPTLEQVFEESVRFHHNLLALRRPDDTRPIPPEPTIAELRKSYRQSPVDAGCEIRELVGQCVWDVFSDNHEVVGSDGRALDLGSFRASGGFLADLLNRHQQGSSYDYLDFYLGTIWVAHRADLKPVYRMIFRRLSKRRHDWVYQFPRLHVIDLSPLTEAVEQEVQADWTNYDPSESLEREEQRIAEMRESLGEGNREAVEEALKFPPPPIVQAYHSIYGRDPQGWPPMP